MGVEAGEGQLKDRCLMLPRLSPSCTGTQSPGRPASRSPGASMRVTAWGRLDAPQLRASHAICDFQGLAPAKERGLYKVRLGFPPAGWPPYV